MKDATQHATALLDDGPGAADPGEDFGRLDELDLTALTVDDLAALKDTVFRSALIGIATQPEISLQVSHQNGSHSSHSDHSTHQNTSPAPVEPGQS